MRYPRSIGARLTLWYAAAFAAALLVLGVAMWFAVRQSLYHAVDESLGDRVDGIHTFLDDHKTRLDVDEVKEEFRADQAGCGCPGGADPSVGRRRERASS